MTTHEAAKVYEDRAALLRSRPDVGFGVIPTRIYFWSDKDRFIAAVRALRPGIKHIDGDDLIFTPNGSDMELQIARSQVCRKIQDAKWECEPLLSPEEEALTEQEEPDGQ